MNRKRAVIACSGILGVWVIVILGDDGCFQERSR